MVVAGRQQSGWTRTVAVIRIPRFNVLDAIRSRPTVPEDPLAVFTTEEELDARRSRR